MSKIIKYLLIFMCIVGIGILVVKFYQPSDYNYQFFQSNEFNIALDKGEYVVGVEYSAIQDDYCKLYSDTTMDAEGNIGVVFGESDLPSSENRVTLNIILENDITNLQLSTGNPDNVEIVEIVVRNVNVYNDSVIIYALFLIFILVLFVLYKQYERKNDLNEWKAICIVLALTLIASIPYMNDYLIWGHDIAFHLGRIEGIYKALINGQLPVRINPVQAEGYGYASSIMYPQLFIYIPAAFRIVGVSLLNSYKILILFVNFMTAFITYFVGKKIFNSRKLGIVACSLYMMSLYRLTDIYLRAAVGEAIAMAFMPLVLYGVYEILYGKSNKWIWATIGFTGVVQSHLLSTEFMLLVCICMFLIAIPTIIKEKYRILNLIKAAGMTLLINLWFLIPVLQYMKLDLALSQENRQLRYSTVYFSQLFEMFIESTGGDIEPGVVQGEMPLTVGPILGIGLVIFIYVTKKAIAEKKLDMKSKHVISIGVFSSIMAIIFLLCSTWIFPWGMLQNISILSKLISTIQFPWRFLTVATLFLTVTATCGIYLVIMHCSNKVNKFLILGGVCSLSVLCSLYYIESASEQTSFKNKGEVVSAVGTDYLYYYIGDSGEYLAKRGNVVTIVEDIEVSIQNVTKAANQVSVQIKPVNEKTENNIHIAVPLYYYPNYKAVFNGVDQEVQQGEHGVLTVSVPQVEGTLEVFFDEPILWKIGNYISLFTVFIYILYCIHNAHYKKET